LAPPSGWTALAESGGLLFTMSFLRDLEVRKKKGARSPVPSGCPVFGFKIC